MRQRPFIAVLVALLFIRAAAQDAGPARRYENTEAYRVYNFLLPREESYAFTKQTLLIGQETMQDFDAIRGCLTSEAQSKFEDAIADFNNIAKTKWLLQPRFQIGKPHKLVGQDIPSSLPEAQGEGPYVEMSAVGFNHDKTRAIVFISSMCGRLCGSSSFHLLEKTDANWKEVPGVICAGAS